MGRRRVVWHYAEDEPLADEDASEVEQAVEEMEDAYINYVDSRRKMKEIALSRGFFPVAALPPSDFGSDLGKSYGKGKAKGKGRAKGKGKGKGKGGDKGGFRKFAFSRRKRTWSRTSPMATPSRIRSLAARPAKSTSMPATMCGGRLLQ